MSFLWHDYETFGTHPAFDRPAQFAAIRTNDDLEATGDPIMAYARPADDFLPHPMACLVTGITPQHAAKEGIPEAEFAALIFAEMSVPGTCSVGYNSLRFDDQVSRHLFYRNFFDPYEREWRNGNSRWDLINVARMCYALRPAGVNWPEREAGIPSFRLEHLTAANEIGHVGAHDALADVQATIDFARLLRDRQPRLYQWALGMRSKATVEAQLSQRRPLLHTSGRLPAARGCTSLVLPLGTVPDRPKEWIVYDLMADPEPLLALEADDIRDRVFTAARDLPEDVERIPLKTVATNKVPMLAPAATLRGVDRERIGLDVERCQAHAGRIEPFRDELRAKLMEVFLRPPMEASGDPDDMLYSGGFFPDRDRQGMARIRDAGPEALASLEWTFEDPRIEEMLFRYRARNWPDSLDAEEAERWDRERQLRLRSTSLEGRLDLDGFEQELAELRNQHADDADAQRILDHLEAWKLSLLP